MFIWSGLGFLVFVIVFAASLLAELSVESSFHDDTYYQSHGWPLAMALICAAIVTWYLGAYLNRQPGRVVIDKQTGREDVLGAVNHHRFFFIPMQYWGAILAVLAIVAFALR